MSSTPSHTLLDGFRREWRRMRSRPLYLFLLVILPLGGWGLLAATFSQGVPQKMPVAIIDHDHSQISRQLERNIDASESMHIAGYATSPEEGDAWMRQGKVYAVIWFEHGLERQLLLGNAAPVAVFYNAQWMLPSSVIIKNLRVIFGTVSATIDVKRRVGAGASLYEAKRAAEPIRFQLHAMHNPALNYSAFLLPALLATLLHIFIAIITIHTIGTEIKHGTADEWLEANNGSILRALITKLSTYILWYFALGMGLFYLTYGPLGIPFRGSSDVFIAGYALMCLAYVGVGMLLISMTANMRLATSLASFITGPAFAFAGVTFPLIAMPPVAKAWALTLPLTHFIMILVQQGVSGYPPALSLTPLIWLAAVPIVLIPLSAIRLHFVTRNPAIWGRV